jgi:hypothetical protein
LSQDSPERWFEIEVLVFKNKQADINEELWHTHQSITFAENTRDFISQVMFPPPQLEANETAATAIPLQPEETDSANAVPSSEQPNKLLQTFAEQGIVPFSPLQDEALQLTNLLTSLSRSSLYEPLVHVAWRQPVYDKDQADWVRIVGGADFSEEFYLDGKSKREELLLNNLGLSSPLSLQSQDNIPLNSNPAMSADQELSTPSNNSLDLNHNENAELAISTPSYIPVPELDGAIQIYLSRYLHINANLVLRIPGEEELDISAISSNLSSSLLDLTQNEQLKSDYESNFSWNYQTDDLFSQQKETTRVERLVNYPMKQSRRIRSGEIHYFDHPLFGLIVQVRPFEIDTITTHNSPTVTSDGN